MIENTAATWKSETSWFERVPKVELHLHLEGAIPHDALWQLVQKYGGDPSVPDLEALERRFEYQDFSHFIETWIWKNRFLREYEDFTLIAEAVARDLAGQNIRYVEAFFSPSDFFHHGLETQKITDTDDPKIFGNPLVEEFRLLEGKLGFSRDEIRSLILQGIQAAWLSEDRKQQLIEAFRSDPAWQQAP